MLACAYILASSGSPIVQVTYPPQTLALEDFVPDCNGITEFTSATSNSTKLKEIPPVVNDWSDETDSTREWTVVYPAGFPDTFEQVLELYTTRRMKPAASSVPIYKRKLGVSIPSQQRWLRYWSQFLASGGHPLSKSPRPSSDRMESGPASYIHIPDSGEVRLTRVVVRMRGLSGVQPSLIQAVSLIKQTTNRNDTDANSNGRVWASVARYDDALIDLLENCGEPSRFLASESLCAFKDDKWDRKKMIRRFASITTTDVQVCTDQNTVRATISQKDKINILWQDTQTSTFNMGSPQGWTDVTTECDGLQPESASPSDGSAYSVVSSLSKVNSDGIVVHANRELRLKLFWVQVGSRIHFACITVSNCRQATLGWIWFIPAFHISPESTSSTVVFTRSEIDCAVGIGKALVDVEVHLVRCAD